MTDATPPSRLEQLLARPDDQRLREYKYRCAQAVVFGLPVFALQWFGPSLGGSESSRWVAVLEALLAGWVVYVGAAGMLFERIVLLPSRGVHVELFVAFLAVALYLTSLVRDVLPIVFTGHVGPGPLLFPWSVAIIAVWSALRWRQFAGPARGPRV